MTAYREQLQKLIHRNDWLDQVREDILDPEIPIVDTHHHLYQTGGMVYEVSDLLKEIGSGHDVRKTVYVECKQFFDDDAPEHLQSVGETRQVAEWAEEMAGTGREIGGIVSYSDLRMPNLDAALDAHEQAGRGRFRGIRHSGAHLPDPTGFMIPGVAPPDLYEDPDFRRGVASLGERGLVYDTWHYFLQNKPYCELAKAVPDTVFVLDHFGYPVNVGVYEGRRDEIFEIWKDDISRISECPNVYAKIGGLGTVDSGFGFHLKDKPPTSDEFVDEMGRYYFHTIDSFGPDRCMFESNYPIDRLSISYPVLWNAFKKMARRYSAAERDAMFHGTACRVYGLTL